jgi:uncharacterized protein
MTEPEDVFRALVAGVTSGRGGANADLYAERTHVTHPFAPGDVEVLTTRDALRAHFEAGRERLAVLDLEPVDVTVHHTDDPEVIVAEFAYAGRHRTTGAAVRIPCVFIMRIRDGLIVESRDYADHAAAAAALSGPTGARDEAFARAVIDGERFMTLATADADGRPWASPVWFAHDGYRDFYWVSRPEARHSRNIEERPEIAIMIFDSGQTPGDGRAVYMAASAKRSKRGLEIFNARSVEQGESEWTEADISGDAAFRLYRATVSEWFVLEEERDVRVPVEPAVPRPPG